MDMNDLVSRWQVTRPKLWARILEKPGLLEILEKLADLPEEAMDAILLQPTTEQQTTRTDS